MLTLGQTTDGLAVAGVADMGIDIMIAAADMIVEMTGDIAAQDTGIATKNAASTADVTVRITHETLTVMLPPGTIVMSVEAAVPEVPEAITNATTFAPEAILTEVIVTVTAADPMKNVKTDILVDESRLQQSFVAQERCRPERKLLNVTDRV